MKVMIIGTGYVGLVQGVCLADIGHEVVCVDANAEKIKQLKKGISPIYEPGIEDLIKKNIASGRLSFTTDFKKYLDISDLVFIAVGTPPDEDGRADLKNVFALAEEIGRNITKPLVLATKSTVPVGTNRKIKEIISAHYRGDLEIISNPEFLREGSAIADFLKPDRIVIGFDKNKKAARKVAELYKPLRAEMLITNLETAEMIKYASNALLATEISFINAIAGICEKTGADVEQVSMGIKLDKRIGLKAFLNAGLGYGGSCFPKDVKALIKISDDHGVNFKILKAVEEVNKKQRQFFILKIKKTLKNLHGKRITILGAAFKPETDDIREAPGITIIEGLLNLGAELVVYDPVARDNIKKMIPRLLFAKSAAAACLGSDAVAIITEWPEFKKLDWKEIISRMKQPLVFDGRNIFSPAAMKEMGVSYFSIGR